MQASDLGRYGIFTREEFLTASQCEELCRTIDRSPLSSGEIWVEERGFCVDQTQKVRKEYAYAASTYPELHQRLFEISDELSHVFDLHVTKIQPLKFTRYEVGEFYRAHRDLPLEANAPDEMRSRKLALTLFLNQQGDSPDEGDYCGGSLTFYGLFDDPSWQGAGVPLDSETGMLVAFRPDLLHEVTPVTHGVRYAITTWLE